MDQRARINDEFTFLRIAITHPDGTDCIKFVGVENEHRHVLEKEIDKIISEFGETLGSPEQVLSALVTILGDKIIPEQRFNTQDIDDNITELLANEG